MTCTGTISKIIKQFLLSIYFHSSDIVLAMWQKSFLLLILCLPFVCIVETLIILCHMSVVHNWVLQQAVVVFRSPWFPLLICIMSCKNAPSTWLTHNGAQRLVIILSKWNASRSSLIWRHFWKPVWDMHLMTRFGIIISLSTFAWSALYNRQNNDRQCPIRKDIGWMMVVSVWIRTD